MATYVPLLSIFTVEPLIFTGNYFVLLALINENKSLISKSYDAPYS